jgi:hypothetical protein
MREAMNGILDALADREIAREKMLADIVRNIGELEDAGYIIEGISGGPAPSPESVTHGEWGRISSAVCCARFTLRDMQEYLEGEER